MSDSNQNVKILNKSKYLFELRMYNPDGYEVKLNPESVFQLVIVDDITKWFQNGFFIYERVFERIL